MNNDILGSILEVAPKTTQDKNQFISHFDKETNSFPKPEGLPHYLQILWTQLENELGKSQFLKNEFFDFKQLKFGGRVIRFRFFLLILFFVELAIFSVWLIQAHSNDNVYQKTFVSGEF